MGLEYWELSPLELAALFTDEQRHLMSGSTAFRLLKQPNDRHDNTLVMSKAVSQTGHRQQL